MLVKRISVAMILVLLIGFGGGCDELLNQEDENALAALAGTWVTTNHYLTNPANTSQQVDLFAQGSRVTLVVESDGSFDITFTDSEGSESDSGTLSVEGSTMTITPTGETPFTVSYLLVSGILTITDTNETWDFDDDGTEEAATAVMVFQHPESSVDLTLSDLAGTFMATSLVVTDQSNPSNSQNMISAGGFFTMVLSADGTTEVILLFPGNSEEDVPEHLIGTSSLVNNGTGLLTDFPGEESDATIGLQVVGTSSVILTRTDVTWDFGAGEVPATMVINLVPVTPPTPAELEGYWSVTEQLNINPENPSQTYDSIVEKVATTIQLTSGGVFAMWDLRYREGPEDIYYNDVGDGTYTMIGNVMSINTGEGDPMLVQLVEDGDGYVIISYDSHDFDDDGTRDWAGLRMTMAPVTTHTLAEMEGAWTATAWTYVDPENPSTTLNAITERHDIVTWVFDAVGGFDVVQSRVDEDVEQFGGTSEIFGNIVRSDDGSGEYHYVVFDLTGSVFEMSMSDWTDPFETGTSSSWRVDVRMVPVTPATSTDFEGSWVASQWEFSDPDGVHSAYDMVADDGSFALTINAGGTMSFAITFPGEPVENGSGTWEIFGDLLIITDDADGYVSAMQYTVGTGTFSMYSNNDVWDFDEDGTEDPALLEIIMVPPSFN